MPGIIEFPKVVQDAMADYGEIFSNECQRRHFAEYLTGLMVAERKTVLGINSEFAATTDQSCLNRFLTSRIGMSRSSTSDAWKSCRRTPHPIQRSGCHRHR